MLFSKSSLESKTAFFGPSRLILESDFVIVLAIWLVLVIVGMRIISSVCTE